MIGIVAGHFPVLWGYCPTHLDHKSFQLLVVSYQLKTVTMHNHEFANSRQQGSYVKSEPNIISYVTTFSSIPMI